MDENGGTMQPSGDSIASVSDPRVQAALERIADSAGIDLNAMPEVLEDVYRRLNSALADNMPNAQAADPGHTPQAGQSPQAGHTPQAGTGPDAAG